MKSEAENEYLKDISADHWGRFLAFCIDTTILSVVQIWGLYIFYFYSVTRDIISLPKNSHHAPTWFLYNSIIADKAHYAYYTLLDLYLNIILILLIITGLLYFSIFESSKLKGTPGKYFFGLKVVDKDMSKLTFEKAFTRNLSRWISLVPIIVGLIIGGFIELLFGTNFVSSAILFLSLLASGVLGLAHYLQIYLTDRRQALHDQIAKTYVINETFLSKKIIIFKILMISIPITIIIIIAANIRLGLYFSGPDIPHAEVQTLSNRTKDKIQSSTDVKGMTIFVNLSDIEEKFSKNDYYIDDLTEYIGKNADFFQYFDKKLNSRPSRSRHWQNSSHNGFDQSSESRDQVDIEKLINLFAKEINMIEEEIHDSDDFLLSAQSIKHIDIYSPGWAIHTLLIATDVNYHQEKGDYEKAVKSAIMLSKIARAIMNNTYSILNNEINKSKIILKVHNKYLNQLANHEIKYESIFLNLSYALYSVRKLLKDKNITNEDRERLTLNLPSEHDLVKGLNEVLLAEWDTISDLLDEIKINLKNSGKPGDNLNIIWYQSFNVQNWARLRNSNNLLPRITIPLEVYNLHPNRTKNSIRLLYHEVLNNNLQCYSTLTDKNLLDFYFLNDNKDAISLIDFEGKRIFFSEQEKLKLLLKLFYGYDVEMKANKILIALSQFRKEHKELPKEINELVPDYIDSIPTDLFNCSQLKFYYSEKSNELEVRKH